MTRVTKEIKQEIVSWIKDEKTEEERYKDFENRLWKLSDRALTEMIRRNEEGQMKAFAGGYTQPDYISHFALRCKFEKVDRARKAKEVK